MRRREFITLVCSAATWPFAARAQQATKTYHIALVHPSLSVADMNETSKGNPSYTVLFKELRRLGYTEGGNLVVITLAAQHKLPAVYNSPYYALCITANSTARLPTWVKSRQGAWQQNNVLFDHFVGE